MKENWVKTFVFSKKEIVENGGGGVFPILFALKMDILIC